MSWGNWLALFLVCATGAMSPGPSLAVVAKATVLGGRSNGVATSWAHAVGVLGYALAVALGLGAVIVGSPTAFSVIRFGGAAFLAFLGLKALRGDQDVFADDPDGARLGPREGFLIAVTNPKIALWFVALFGQFVDPEMHLDTKATMAMVAFAVDGLWYTTVALALSVGPVLHWLRQRGVWIDRAFGVLLLAIAARVVWI